MFLYLLLLFFTPTIHSFKILIFTPGFAGSHVLFSNRLGQSLTSLGHKVTIWSVQDLRIVPHITAPQNVTKHLIECDFIPMTQVFHRQVKETLPFGEFMALWQLFMDEWVRCCQKQLSDYDHLITQLKDESFDLAIGHVFDGCPTMIMHELGIQKAVYVSAGMYIVDSIASILAINTNPSYIPNFISRFSDQMTFKQRLGNFFWTVPAVFANKMSSDTIFKQNIMFRHPPYSDNPDLVELSSEIYYTNLINGERFMDFPRALPEGVPFLGEMSTPQGGQIKSLDEKFSKLVNEKNKGVIVFSLGTIAKWDDMPDYLKIAFLKGLANFTDYTVIWRFEGQLAEASSYPHIHLVSWIPQRELLKHPRTKLFITHGGFNSLVEATRAGVPLILMPLFVDQKGNSMRAERHGFGVSLVKTEITQYKVQEAVSQVLNNPRFAERAKAMSTMFDDKPASPEKLLQHTLNSIIKHPKWFPKLRSAQKLNTFQLYCIDIILFWSALVIFGLFIMIKLVKYVIL